jgi:hypothetical protein
MQCTDMVHTSTCMYILNGRYLGHSILHKISENALWGNEENASYHTPEVCANVYVLVCSSVYHVHVTIYYVQTSTYMFHTIMYYVQTCVMQVCTCLY